MSDEPMPAWAAALAEGQARLEAQGVQTRADLMARLDRLQDAVAALRDDNAVTFGSTDRVDRAVQATREEGRATAEVLSVVVRQVRRLQAEVAALRGEGERPGAAP